MNNFFGLTLGIALGITLASLFVYFRLRSFRKLGEKIINQAIKEASLKKEEQKKAFAEEKKGILRELDKENVRLEKKEKKLKDREISFEEEQKELQKGLQEQKLKEIHLLEKKTKT